MLAGHPDESTLLDFTAGALLVAERDALIDHLDGCSRCRQMLSSLSRGESSTYVGAGAGPELEATHSGDPLQGQMLGEYQVHARIGQGGMGVLYRGEQPLIGKAVAIKVLLPEVAADPNLVHRLLGEARAVNAIRHPNIVDIFSFGQLPDGRPYMVMELLEGQPLSEVLRERRTLEFGEVLVVLDQSMAALEAAHTAGVIHRDLKPENIFVNRLADGWRITLLDFGLAKQLGSSLTAPNLVMGTPGYMAPEQIRGVPVTAKTDIYAMGVVGWRLLAGSDPYQGGSIVEIMRRHVEEPVPPLRPRVAGCPPALEELVLEMMAKDPARRPSASAVRKALARIGKELHAASTVRLGAVAAAVDRSAPTAAHRKIADHLAETSLVRRPGMETPTGREAVVVEEEAHATAPELERVDADLLVTRPDRAGIAPATLRETPIFPATQLRAVPTQRGRLLPVAFGLLLGAVIAAAGFYALREPPPLAPVKNSAPQVPDVDPPQVVVEAPGPEAVPIPTAPVVQPPVVNKPRGPSRAEVAKSLAAVRVRATKMTNVPTRRVVELQLGRLNERLEKGEPPGMISRELEQVLKEYGLR